MQSLQQMYQPSASSTQPEKKVLKTAIIYSPVTGIGADLSTAPDEGFAEGMMGEGAVVTPKDPVICAPEDGEVEFIFDTKHAIGFQTDTDLPMLLHIGIDTVKLEGKGFEILVEQGQHVKKRRTTDEDRYPVSHRKCSVLMFPDPLHRDRGQPESTPSGKRRDQGRRAVVCSGDCGRIRNFSAII